MHTPTNSLHFPHDDTALAVYECVRVPVVCACAHMNYTAASHTIHRCPFSSTPVVVDAKRAKVISSFAGGHAGE